MQLQGRSLAMDLNQLPPNQQYVGWQHMPEKEFDVMFPDQKLSTQQSLPENQQQPLDL